MNDQEWFVLPHGNSELISHVKALESKIDILIQQNEAILAKLEPKTNASSLFATPFPSSAQTIANYYKFPNQNIKTKSLPGISFQSFFPAKPKFEEPSKTDKLLD
jgi:hypothetical protein